MTAFLMLVLGLAAGAFPTYRYFAPRLAQLKEQHRVQLAATQDAEAKWLELVSLLDENGQLPEGAAAKILQPAETSPEDTRPKLTKKPGNSSHRCTIELARIKAGRPSLDSLEGMNSAHCYTVLLARIKAGQPLQHNLEGLTSAHRTAVALACAEAGIEV